MVDFRPDDRVRRAPGRPHVDLSDRSPAVEPRAGPVRNLVDLVPPARRPTGTWTAKGTSGTTVELTLKSDGHFTWTATVNGKTRSFSAQYTAGEGLLTLVSDNGPAIVGRITGVGNGFNFKLIGSGPGDPGLTFAR